MPRMKCPNCDLHTVCNLGKGVNEFECTNCRKSFKVTSPDTAEILPVEADILHTTQKDRQSNYGAWMDHAKTVDIMMEGLRDINKAKNNGELYWPTGFETNMFYIVTKIARMATDPHHHDSTLDLKSYADLWLKEIEGDK